MLLSDRSPLNSLLRLRSKVGASGELVFVLRRSVLTDADLTKALARPPADLSMT